MSPRKKWYFSEKVDPWHVTTCQLSGCRQQKATKKVTFLQGPKKSDFFYRVRLQKVPVSYIGEGRLGDLGMARSNFANFPAGPVFPSCWKKVAGMDLEIVA